MNKPGISEAERNKLNKNITAMISRSKEDMVIGNSLEIIQQTDNKHKDLIDKLCDALIAMENGEETCRRIFDALENVKEVKKAP